MLKKTLSILVVIAFVVSLFVACGENNTASSGQSPKTIDTNSTDASVASTQQKDPNSEAFTISTGNWMVSTGKPNADSFKANVEKLFKAKYPNATIDWSLSNAENYFELLKAKLASNSAPDVFFHQNSLSQFGNAGYLVDLSDQPWVANILDAAKPSVIYKGKVLAAPYDMGGWGIYYNKKIFTDLGITAAPETFADFLGICEKIKAAGIAPITDGFKKGYPAGGTFLAFASFAYGADNKIALDIYNGKEKFNGSVFKTMLDAIQTLVTKGYFAENIMSTDTDQAYQMVGTGKAAMMFNGPWCVATLATKYNCDTGFFELPDANGYNCASASINSALSINSQTDDKQRAIDLFNAILDKSSMSILDKNAAFSPFKGFEIEQDTVGMKEAGTVFASLDSTWQLNIWTPPSLNDKMQQIVLKIASGKGYDEADLDDFDRTYQKDKALVDSTMFDLIK